MDIKKGKLTITKVTGGYELMGKNPFIFFDEEARRKFEFIPVDKWAKRPFENKEPMYDQDTVFMNTKGYIIAPINYFYNRQIDQIGKGLDAFVMSTKKCYNSTLMRDHICQYNNYFLRFYDPDKEYIAMLANIKYLIDYVPEYRKDLFIYDIVRYILSPSIVEKTRLMTEDNYSLNLSYKNNTNPSLQYTDDHAKLLMQMSILMNLVIPLLTHFAFVKKVIDIDQFLLEVFDYILHLFNVDIYNKFYETSTTNVGKNAKQNPILWGKQDIRGKDVITHSKSSIDNIILNIMPKYVFNQNVVSLNYTSITKNTGFQITDIQYEFSYIPLSSSKRDEDNTSEFDKFESTLVKQSEAKYLQVKVNCNETMNIIDNMFGPFDQEEINFYRSQIKGINEFQKQLIFNLFYKYFGDSVSINAINNKIDYIKLMIVAKRMLLNSGMIMLPYIISGKLEKIVGRKSVNKKEQVQVESSDNYKLVVDKYRNNKISKKRVLSTIATIISSDFSIIDYYNKDINGKKIDIIPDIVIEEVLLYILMI